MIKMNVNNLVFLYNLLLLLLFIIWCLFIIFVLLFLLISLSYFKLHGIILEHSNNGVTVDVVKMWNNDRTQV